MGIRIDDPSIEARAKHPRYRGFAALEEYVRMTGAYVVTAVGENPFCGDELEVRLALGRTEAGELAIERAAFDGYGCALCLAAADTVMERVTGMAAAKAAQLIFDDVCALMGGLEVGRTRKGCADLAVRVMAAALEPVRAERVTSAAGKAIPLTLAANAR